MAFYFSDFFSDPHVHMMSHQQIGMYWDLLKFAWHNNPPATIPNDREAIRNILRYSPGNPLFEDNIDLILKCFKLRKGRDGEPLLLQERLSFEYGTAIRKKQKTSRAGKIGRKAQLVSQGKSTTSRAVAGDRPANDLSSLLSSSVVVNKSNSKTTNRGSAEGGKPKGNGKTHPPELRFTESPLREWEAFRAALDDWPEAKARFYFDLFREKEGMHPGKYKYAAWNLAARAWDRREPNQWKQGAAAESAPKSFEELKKGGPKK